MVQWQFSTDRPADELLPHPMAALDLLESQSCVLEVACGFRDMYIPWFGKAASDADTEDFLELMRNLSLRASKARQQNQVRPVKITIMNTPIFAHRCLVLIRHFI
jgi:hypothetical protein